jgi:hypothetical protein
MEWELEPHFALTEPQHFIKKIPITQGSNPRPILKEIPPNIDRFFFSQENETRF